MKIKITGLLMLLAALPLPCRASTTRPLPPLPTKTPRPFLTLPANPDHFRFIVTGDNRAAGRGLPMPPTMGEICEEAGIIAPDFMLWTGDAIYGSDVTPGEAEAEYDTFLALASKANVPIFNAPGNHEIFNRADLAAVYEKRMGPLYGSFDYGNAHIIALDTEEVGIAGGVSAAQIAWLEADLKANQGARHRFVFSHHPLFPSEANEGFDLPATRDALHKLFRLYGVKNVFSGHEHKFYKSVHDGITYWVSGGAGAPTSGSPEEGGYQHFVLFEVNDNTVTGTVLQPWRLFTNIGPAAPDGTCSASVVNYNGSDLAVSVDLPAANLPASLAVSASWTYKGKTTPLTAAIAPSRRLGVVTVRLTVPAHRGALVTVKPK